MAQEKLVCGSCKKRIANDSGRVVFACPKCGEETIIRCSECRRLGVKYKCSKCGFVGPN